MSSLARLGVAVFARTPGSAGKSRLAATVGRETTDEFYLHCLQCARAWLEGCRPQATPHWALTGPGGYSSSLWGKSMILDQGGGGLGQRMFHISHCLMANHHQWCLVGTDIPQMPPLADLEISKRLFHSDFVFGPATDGGFWLAAGRRLIPAANWSRITYSRQDTLQCLITSLQKECANPVVDSSLPALTDIDQQEDLSLLRDELQGNGSTLNSEQRSLLEYLFHIT